MTHFSLISVRATLLAALIIGSLSTADSVRAETYQASKLERSLVKIFFLPVQPGHGLQRHRSFRHRWQYRNRC